MPRRSFFLGSQHVLASTARDGQLIVWHVSEGGDATLTGQQALALQLPAAEGGASARLAWHPSCQDVLFFTAGARVLAAHISELTASAQQVSRTALLFCLGPPSGTLLQRVQESAAAERGCTYMQHAWTSVPVRRWMWTSMRCRRGWCACRPAVTRRRSPASQCLATARCWLSAAQTAA